MNWTKLKGKHEKQAADPINVYKQGMCNNWK